MGDQYRGTGGAKASRPGGDTRAAAGHSADYAAMLAYLEWCADRLAPLLAPKTTRRHMRGLLCTAFQEIAAELERAGYV